MNDEQLRRLLGGTVSDVEPRRGLDDIRSRTGSTRSRAWGVAGAVLATAATIAVVAAVGGLPGTTDARPGPAGAASTAPSPEQSASTQGTASPTLRVYFVGDTGGGPRLFRELHAEPQGYSLDVAVAEAVRGAAEDPDYGSPWPEGTALQRAQLSDGVLSVDLSGPVAERPSGMSPAEAEMALQQLVYTAQSAVQDTVPVTFLLDGRPTDTVLGVATDEPVARGSADDVLAPVSVSTPADGATVSSPFTVAGDAAAFEANVQWELEQGGTVVRRGFTTAEECCTLSPYSFTVKAPPGTYTLVVHDEDPSGGEGVPPSQDTKTIEVTD